METTVNNTDTVTETVVAKTPRISANTVEALELGKAGLTELNGIAHHTVLVAHLSARNPKSLDIATKIWNDARTNDKSEFKFLKNGVFALANTQYTEDDAKKLVPARKTAAPRAVDPTKAAAKIEKLKAQLAALEAAVATAPTE